MSISEKLTTVAENVQKVYDAGKEQGKQAQYNEFWDEYQNKGLIYSCPYIFAFSKWNDKTFKPKYSLLHITDASNMFNTCGVTDLQAALDAQGVTFNFENSALFNYTFAYSNLTRIGIINTTKSNSLSSTFTYAERLTTIDKLILKSGGTQTFSGTFTACTSLANIIVEGVIGNNISFSGCPLSKDSIKSIVDALSSATTNRTLALKKTAVNKAFGIDVDDEATWTEEFTALRNSKSNWTFSYM